MARRRLLSDLWATYKDNVKQEEKISLEMFSEDGGTTGLSGTSQIVYIECSGPWERSGNTPSWITLTPSSGKGGETKVTVSADEAPSTKDREGVVTITSQSTLEQLEIEVSQQGIQDFIKVEEIDGPYDSLDEGSSTYHADWCESGEVKSIKLCYPKDSVTSPSSAVGIYDIKVSTVDSASSESYDYVTYSFKWASGDTKTDQTSGTTTHWHKYITFVTRNGASFTYNVYQDPKSFISVSNPAITNVSYSGTAGSISYKTHNPAGLDDEYPYVTHPKVIVSADTSNAVLFGTSSDNCSSTTVTLSDKEGTLYYKVLARDNQAFSDRTIKVTFTCEDYSATGDCANASGYTDFTLSQGGYPYIRVTPDNKSVGANASSFTLSVSSNTSWSLTENSDWVSLDKTSGNAGLTSGIVCKYNENTNVATSRKATIRATSSILTSVSATCVVTQSAATPYIYINGSTDGAASVSNSATSYSITIESNDDWTLSVDNGAGLTPYVGTGDSSSTINFGQNTDSEPIYYTITAKTIYGASATFTLAQRGALWLIPSYSAGAIVSSADTSDSAQQSITIRVPSGETSVQVSFSSSGAWSKVAYGDTVNWCSANTTNGANGTVITYTISANDSIEERTTESAFTYNLDSQETNDYDYSVIFIQEGQDPYLTLKNGSSEEYQRTVYQGSVTITVTADTNCTWDVYDYTQGLTVTPSGNGTRNGGTIRIKVPSTEIVTSGVSNTYVVTIKTNDSAIATSEQITKTYTINQRGVQPYVEFVDASYSVQADTITTVTGYVSANTAWRITVDGTYVTGVSPATGFTGLSNVAFTVAQHTATTQTTAKQRVTSTIFPAYTDTTNIIIGAFSPELSCPSAVYIPFAETSNTITVIANAAWKITASGDFTTSPTGSGTQGDTTKTTVNVKSSISNTGMADKLLGTITVKLTNYSLSQTVNVYKKCEQKTTLTVTPTQLGSSGGKLSIGVSTTEGTGTLYIGGPVTSSTSSDVSTGSFSFSEICTTINGSKTYLYTITTENTSTTTYNIYCVRLVLDNGSIYYCQVPQNPEPLQISVEPTSKSVSWTGGTVSATISTNDPNGWKITSMSNRQMISSPSLSTTGQDGLTLSVVVEPTYSLSGTVSGSITFACTSDTNKTATLTLTQDLDDSHWVPTVYIDWKYDTVSYSTTANTLYYTANTNFSVTCTGGTNFSTTNNVTVGGKLLSTTTGSITISGFGTNSSESDRVFWASISVDLDGYSMSDMNIGVDVSFTQNPYSPEISVSPSTVTVTTPQSGTTSAIYVYASDKWSADVSDMPDWATLSTTAGTGNATVYISYEDNSNVVPRDSGSITFALVDYPSYTAELTISATSASAAGCATTYTNITLVFTQNETACWDFEFYTDGFEIPAYDPLGDFGIYINDVYGYVTPIGSWYGTSGGETNIETIRSIHDVVITKLGVPISVTAGTANQYWHTYSNGTHTYTKPKYDIQVYAFDVITPTLELSTVREIAYDDTAITISVSSNTSWEIGLSDSSYTPTDYATNLPGGPSPSSITGSGNKTITFTVPQNYSASTFTTEKTFCFTGTTTYGHVDTYVSGYGVPEATASTTMGQEGYDDRVTPIITMTPTTSVVNGGTNVNFGINITVGPSGVTWKLTGESTDGGKIKAYGPTDVMSVTSTTANGVLSGSDCTYIFTITTIESDKYKVATESCQITQEALDMTNSISAPDSIDESESSTTISIMPYSGTVAWTASCVTTDNSKLYSSVPAVALNATLSPTTGTGNSSITLTVGSVARSSTPIDFTYTVTVKFASGTPLSISQDINQSGRIYLTRTDGGTVSSGGGNVIFYVMALPGDGWVLNSSPTTNTITGTGTTSNITIHIPENTSTSTKSYTFVVTRNADGYTSEVTVTQSG